MKPANEIRLRVRSVSMASERIAPMGRPVPHTKGRGCTPSHGSPGAFGGQLPNYHMGHVACSYTLLMKYLNHDEIVHLRFADREAVASR
jgi:hypothetical protein